MSKAARENTIRTTIAIVSAVLGVLGYWGLQKANATSDGEHKGSIDTRVTRNENDIKEVRSELAAVRGMFGTIDRSLGRIEGKLGIQGE